MIALGSSSRRLRYRGIQLLSLVNQSAELFEYHAGDDWEAMGGTFTRASLATYIDDQQMVRYAPHNTHWDSGSIGNVSWAVDPGVSVQLNTAISPEGSMTASKVIEGATYGSQRVFQLRAFPFRGFGTVSVYAKAGERNWVLVDPGLDSNQNPTFFNLSTGTIGYSAAGSTNTIENVGNGWFRCSVTRSYTTTGGNGYAVFGVSTSDGMMGYTGDGVSGAYFWGSQVECHPTARKYLPTGAAARFDGLRDSHYVYDDQTESYVRSSLLEGQRTNLIKYSQDLSQITAWASSQPVLANNAAAPDGSNTANKVTLGVDEDVYQFISATGVTASIFLKGTAGQQVRFSISDTASKLVTFNGSWQRVFVTAETGSTTIADFSLHNYARGAFPALPAVTFWAWGGQVEVSPFASSYIPTTSASVSRADDLLSFPVAYPPQEMSVYARGVEQEVDASSRYFEIGDDGSSNPRIISLAGGNGTVNAYWFNAAGGASLSSAGGLGPAKSAEILQTLSAAGNIQATTSINGDTPTVAVAGGAIALGDNWTVGTRARIGPIVVIRQTFFAYRDFIISKGVRDLTYFRDKIEMPPVPDPIKFRYSVGDDWAAKGGTFTRASLATYVDENQMVRFAPHNVVLQSQSLATSSWVQQDMISVTNNAGIAPDGTNTASLLVFDRAAVSQTPRMFQAVAFAGTSPKVLSLYVKGTAGETFNIADGVGVQTRFTLNGSWQRVSLVTTAQNPYFIIAVYAAVETASTFLAWGAQIEQNPSAGNYLPTTTAARFDGLRDTHYAYDPQTEGYVRTTLLEGQRTNLCLQSQSIGTAPWSNAGLTISSDTVVAPDGSTTAEVVSGISAASTYVEQTISSLAPSSAHTISVWVKKAPSSPATHFRISTNNSAIWNTGASQKFALTDSWQRVSLTYTIDATGTVQIVIGSFDATGTHDPDCYGGVAVWGFQLEAGSFPSSYIPTTSASVTRANESFQFPYTTPPREMSIYTRAARLADPSSVDYVAWIGGPNFPCVATYDMSVVVGIFTNMSSGAIQNQPGLNSVAGDQIENLGIVTKDGHTIQIGSINGGAKMEFAGTQSFPLDPAFSSPIISVFQHVTGGTAIAGRDIIVAKGIRDLAYFRALLNSELPIFSYKPGDSLSGATFTRASAATYVNENGLLETVAAGVCRDNHYTFSIPENKLVRSTLLEGQRTNQVTNSNTFTGWTTTAAVVTPAAGISPDGTNNASSIALPSNDAFYKNIGVAAPNTGSIWVKGTSGQQVRFGIGTGPELYLLHTFSGAWQRISFTNTGANADYMLLHTDSRGGSAVLPAVTFLVYGAQVEAGNSASSYIATTSAAVTRAQDGLQFPWLNSPQPVSAFVKMSVPYSNSGTDARVLCFGYPANLSMIMQLRTSFQSVAVINGVSSGATGGGYAPGDSQEFVGRVTPAGATSLEVSLNGGSSIMASDPTAAGFPAAWNSPALFVGAYDSSAFASFQKIAVFRGKRDLTFFRNQP